MTRRKMDIKKAYQLVIDDLDANMQKAPNRMLADISNYLQARLDELTEA